MNVQTLASGSSGNCLLVSAGATRLLVDCGISAKRIKLSLAQLDLTPADLSGVLITHEHSDHIAGLATLTKHFPLRLYTSPGTARALTYRMAGLDDLLHTVEPGESFEVGELGVETYPISHDAAQPMGFALTADGKKAAVVTDLGYVSDAVRAGIRGADLLVCEANHDLEWLRSGSYPQYLISRIAGDRGHLCNEDGAALACLAAESGARTVVLAHLSAENTTPERARAVVADALARMGADPERDVALSVAPRSELGPRWTA